MNLKSLIPIGRDRNVVRSDLNVFDTLQREIDRVFADFTRGFPSFGARDLMPSIDVTETDKEFEIIAELPGLEEKDVQINLADNIITIKGEKKADKEEKDKNYHLVERSYGMFERAFSLGADVETDKVEASFDKGVLKIVLPKLATAQPKVKKIEVKPAA